MSDDMLQRIKSRCKYFNGVQNDTCEAGVIYENLPREKNPARGIIGIPCINPNLDCCAKREYPTDAEAKAEADEMNAAIENFMERLKNGDCPHCGKKVEKRVQVGPCVYAEPCGHRIGQGKA